MTFKNAVENTPIFTRTENGAVTMDSSLNPCLDWFYQSGALRNGDPTSVFSKAFSANSELAIRTLLWARDIRGGAGERKTFRTVVQYLENVGEVDLLEIIIPTVAEYGRWDDLLVFKTDAVKNIAYSNIQKALEAGNGLCAKWMPRKGPISIELRKFLGLSPKQYRKLLVGLTNVVETQMCSKEWDSIKYAHVPSLAMSRYRKAFTKHDSERYSQFNQKVISGEEKVNVGAVYPYDVLKEALHNYYYPEAISRGQKEAMIAQWQSLPNFMGNSKMLPMVDVSGSMTTKVGGTTSALEVAVSLGLYMADKQEGDFNNLILTFSAEPQFFAFDKNADIVTKATTMASDDNWMMNTNINKAMDRILDIAVMNNTPQKDMPAYLVILSDMEFDQATTGRSYFRSGDSGENTINSVTQNKFRRAGYEVPTIVYWNLCSRHNNFPVTKHETGTCLVSGFSPAIVKRVLAAENITPEGIMLDTIMDERYNIFDKVA